MTAHVAHACSDFAVPATTQDAFTAEDVAEARKRSEALRCLAGLSPRDAMAVGLIEAHDEDGVG